MTDRADADAAAAEVPREELARALAATRAELASTIEAHKAFAYSVSHDLRAPLRAIAGFSAMLQEDAAATLGDDARPLLQTIIDNAHVLSTQLDGLLVLSRLAHRELRTAPLDMTAVAAAAVAQMRTLEPDREVAVTIAPLAPATADPELIRTGMLALLENAWKFTRPRPAPEVAIECEPRPSEIVYRIRDNGVGVPVNAVGRLFVPFGRVHGPKEFAGLGIGLAAAKTIINRHGGRIWVETNQPSGATFAFTLPA